MKTALGDVQDGSFRLADQRFEHAWIGFVRANLLRRDERIEWIAHGPGAQLEELVIDVRQCDQLEVATQGLEPFDSIRKGLPVLDAGRKSGQIFFAGGEGQLTCEAAARTRARTER